METAIEIENLTKVYQKLTILRFRSRNEPVAAVDNVTLTVGKGELFGLLGPNGAGKTTLVKMLCTLILPSSGTAKIAGSDLADAHAIRAKTGLVVSDERSFFWRLTARRNLDFFSNLYGLHGQRSRDRIHTVLQEVDLLDRADQEFSSLSSGMRQRLAIARALLHEPQILFLDEPTRSLDPISTRRMHKLILRLLHQKAMTVFLITHDLAEAEKLCHRVALMHRAKIRKIGHPEALRRHLDPKRNYKLTCNLPQSIDLGRLRDHVPSLRYLPSSDSRLQSELRFQAGENEGELTAVVDFLRQENIQISTIEGAPPTLEEVFAHYTGGADER